MSFTIKFTTDNNYVLDRVEYVARLKRADGDTVATGRTPRAAARKVLRKNSRRDRHNKRCH